MRAHRIRSELSIVVMSLVFGAWLLGWERINPYSVEWLLSGDRANHFIGWLFFRGEEWHLPLGGIAGLLYPHGTNVGFTDSIPLAALLFKLFQGLLPSEFQYFGLFLLTNFALQGYFAFHLVKGFGASDRAAILASLLFVTFPPFLRRHGHAALTSHFLLLAVAGSILAGGDFRKFALPCILALFIHPYLWVMVFALSLTGLFSRRFDSVRGFLKLLGLSLVGVGVLFGPEVLKGEYRSVGFGGGAADLLSLINPRFEGGLLPTLPMPPNPSEGYGYLGLGGLFVFAVALLRMFEKNTRQKLAQSARRYWIPLIAFPSLCFIYSLSDRVHFMGREVINLQALYSVLGPLTEQFRASGRFIWPVGYAVLGWSVFTINGRRASWFLAIALALQLTDLGLTGWKFGVSSNSFLKNGLTSLERLRGVSFAGIKEIRIIPPLVVAAGIKCDSRRLNEDMDEYYLWAYLAGRNGLRISSGITSRASKRVLDNCSSSVLDTKDPEVVYVFSENDTEFAGPSSHSDCYVMDAWRICRGADGIPSHRKIAFQPKQ